MRFTIRDWIRSFELRGRLEATGLGATSRADYYGGVVIGAQTIGARALEESTHDEVNGVLARLDPDDYSEYVRAYIAKGRGVAGSEWRYADITTVLSAATRLLEPRRYLEIGVRRGRSMAIVAAGVPESEVIGIDLWVRDYAGMENPGPEFVRGQLDVVGFTGALELISGDSHEILPRLFADRPELTFDLITVDGDHTPSGARRDLRDVLPRLRVGGAIVFDDIAHHLHAELAGVWRRATRDPCYSTWEFDDVGYGVAVAVRRW